MSLQGKLAAARRRWRLVVAAGGGAATLGLFALLCVVSYHTDRLLALTTPGRAAWLAVLCAVPLLCLAALVVMPMRRPLTDEAVAAQVESAYPALGERLISTVELAHAGAAAGVSAAMVRQLAGDAERVAAPLDFVRAVPTDRVRRPAAFAGIAAIVLFGHVALAPREMGVWLRRILFPGADIPLYAHTRVWVTPGDTVVPRGEAIDIAVRTAGTLPDRATLHYRFDGGRWSLATLRPASMHLAPAPAGTDAARYFMLRLPDLQQNLTYYATAGDGQANAHTITVEDRPTVLHVRLRLDYPAYTHKPANTVLATAGNVVAPVGTHVDVEATANKTLGTAFVVEGSHPKRQITATGDSASTRLVVMHDETYSLLLTDMHGFADANPPQYTVRAEPDQPPQVQIVKPAMDLERTPNGSLDLRVTATDDYGVHDMHVAYNVEDASGAAASAAHHTRLGELPLPISSGARQVASGGPWSLARLGLQPGDTVTYAAVARDGDDVSGPHAARSAEYHVRIIGAAEMRERLDAQKAEEREALRQLVQRQKDAQAQLSAARKTARPEARATAEAAQRSVAQEASDLVRRMQQTTQQLQDNDLARPAEQQKRNAVTTELDRLAQKSMPAAADTVQRRQLSSAAQQEEQIHADLQRLSDASAPAPSLLKLAQQAEQLSQAQQKLADDSALQNAKLGGRTPDQQTAQERAASADQARRQAELQQHTAALQSRLQQAAKDAQERAQANALDLQRAAQQLPAAGTERKQADARSSLQQGQPAQATPQQMDAARDLQKLANSLDQAALRAQDPQAMGQRGQQLEQLADQLGDLGFKQSRAARQMDSRTTPESARSLAQQEQQMRAQAQQLGSQLSDLPQTQQGVNRATGNMQQAANQLEQNDTRSANSSAREAARQLMQASQDVRNAARAMRQAQETHVLQQKVEQLAREQRALQGQTEDLDRRRQAPGISAERRQQLDEEADSLAHAQGDLEVRTGQLTPDAPSQPFGWALEQAQQRMGGARRGLERHDPGDDTRRQEQNAARILERIARSLGQQAQGEQQAAEQEQSGAPEGEESAMAQAQGELQLAREMQAQIHEETASVDQRRSRNTDHKPTADQDREIESLAEAERATQQIARRATAALRGAPDIAQVVQRAAERMDDIRSRLQGRATESGTQQREQQVVNMLDQALTQSRQAMRQQRQQMAQRQQSQQGQQQAQQSGQQQSQQQAQGNRPGPRFAPIEQARNAVTHGVNAYGRGFGNLSPRAQQLLREGQQERVPAEYRDLVNQYYKALSERGR